ncbi:MAG: aspartate aminotransferase family protein [Alphaproteobacteria bacterium]|nr:aspartate aminotransferase family protein [Alphaproteobacteria bacterium]MBU0797710.1 aspartate aminotransferase family protein [Alphaproteobacteria bacterium]MBU0885897.1 aspartate aminotransferase family protein [Alphaproteobacteria bacterium]MBU1814603.1 aspartate aminotransferase family protein [Alphaproteobacteria bacterium]MBU2091978.1 aspartate aminotransferase family protein [Alphaproteobacteria bacterium]
MTFVPNSASARDIAHHLHPYTNLKAHETEGPLVITRGKGVYVYDEDGKDYLEAMAGLWSASLGFSEDRLVDAAVKQLKELPYYHTFAHKAHLPSIDLAEKLKALAPVPMSKVIFQNSGSEANDTVVKLVWYYHNAIGKPEKKKIISRIKGYHGVTVASASLTGLPNNHRDFDLPIANILHADCPHWYRFAQDGESEEDFATRLATNLENLILKEGPDTVGAFIAEPIMGAGGVIVPPKTYFEKIQAVLQKYEILFIADEVICGFGRTGNYWGSQTFDLKPDMISCAKALSASYLPISAVLVNEKVYQAMVVESEKIGIFGHGYTYSGHPVCAAVALEALKIYDERNIVEHVRTVGAKLQAGLRKFLDHPLVGEVRGTGLIAAVEMVQDKKTRASFDPKLGVGAKLGKLAQANGLIVRAMGDSIAFTPPLIITEAEIDILLERMKQALDETLAWIDEQGLTHS